MIDIISAQDPGATQETIITADANESPDAATETHLNRIKFMLDNSAAGDLVATASLALTGSTDLVNGSRLPGRWMGMTAGGYLYFATMNNTSGSPSMVLWHTERQ